MRCPVAILVLCCLAVACQPPEEPTVVDDDDLLDDDDDQDDDDLQDDDDSALPWSEVAPLGIELLRLPAGTFVMGSPADEIGRHDNEDQHEVILTRSFFIGRVEVTQSQYEALTGRTPSGFVECGPDCPVEALPWDEAALATNLLSDLAGLTACYVCSGEGPQASCSSAGDPYLCDGYRLPTEAEWEYAARSAGTVTGTYPSGGSLQSPDDALECEGQLVLSDGSRLDDQAWYCGNAEETTHPVGVLEPNAAGLYDMAGNVWDYVHDWYAPYPDEPVTDPWGPETGDLRIKRGGPWKKYPVDMRMAERFEYDPTQYHDTMGFRVARTAHE